MTAATPPRAPSSSTPRLLTLLVMLLGCSLFVGNWVFTIVVGRRWSERVQYCELSERTPAVELPGALDRQASIQACLGELESVRLALSLAALAVVAAVAAIVTLAATPRIERRRRLRPADQRFASAQDRFLELVAEAGLRRPPALMIGSLKQTDAFTYGRPGGYRVAIPPALAVRPQSALFGCAVRHELQHVVHRDVPLAWSVKSMGTALAAGFGLPIALSVAGRDLSLVRSFLPRAAVLVVFVLLARAAWLLSRELDADIAAATAAGDAGPFRIVLLDRAGRSPADRRSGLDVLRTWWRRALATHPEPQLRVALQEDPTRPRSVTFADGLVPAFAATFVLPLVSQTLSPVLAVRGAIGQLDLLSALVVGPMVGAALGLGLWQAHGSPKDVRTGDTRRERAVPLAGVSAGALIGALAGQLASFAGAGSGLTSLDHPVFVLIIALATAGTAVLAAGVAGAWASGRYGRARWAWIPPTAVSVVLFSHLFWWSTTLAKAFDWGGWALALSLLVTVLVQPAAAITAAGLALAAAAVLISNGSRALAGALLTGATAGLVGGLTIVAYRVAAGPAPHLAAQEQRYYTYLVMSAATAGAVGLTLALSSDPVRRGAALVVTATSAAGTQLVFVLLNTVLGGDLTWDFTGRVVLAPVSLSLLALTLVGSLAAVLALRPPRRPVARAVSGSAPRPVPGSVPRLGRPAVARLAAVTVLSAAVAVGIVTGRSRLLPVFELAGVTSQVTTEQERQPWMIQLGPVVADELSTEAQVYIAAYAYDLDRLYRSYYQVGSTLTTASTDLVEAMRASIDQLLAEMDQAQLVTSEVRGADAHLRAAFTALRTGELPAADAEYREWRRAVYEFGGR